MIDETEDALSEEGRQSIAERVYQEAPAAGAALDGRGTGAPTAAVSGEAAVTKSEAHDALREAEVPAEQATEQVRYVGAKTFVLRDRVFTAAQLYFAGKVEKLLMSGDNRFVYYNEPAAMRAYALQLGVPEQDIVLDYAGRRTYDTCYRAQAIFGINQAILVTQNYHLPRALFTCNALGLPAIGVAADQRTYHPRSYRLWQIREIPATLVAFWETGISHPLPVLGQPEPIFPNPSKHEVP